MAAILDPKREEEFHTRRGRPYENPNYDGRPLYKVGDQLWVTERSLVYEVEVVEVKQGEVHKDTNPKTRVPNYLVRFIGHDKKTGLKDVTVIEWDVFDPKTMPPGDILYCGDHNRRVLSYIKEKDKAKIIETGLVYLDEHQRKVLEDSEKREIAAREKKEAADKGEANAKEKKEAEKREKAEKDAKDKKAAPRPQTASSASSYRIHQPRRWEGEDAHRPNLGSDKSRKPEEKPKNQDDKTKSRDDKIKDQECKSRKPVEKIRSVKDKAKDTASEKAKTAREEKVKSKEENAKAGEKAAAGTVRASERKLDNKGQGDAATTKALPEPKELPATSSRQPRFIPAKPAGLKGRPHKPTAKKGRNPAQKAATRPKRLDTKRKPLRSNVGAASSNAVSRLSRSRTTTKKVIAAAVKKRMASTSKHHDVIKRKQMSTKPT